MTRCSIGLRLATWYAAILAVSLVGFGLAMWVAVRHTMYHAVDESLEARFDGIGRFLTEQVIRDPEDLLEELLEHAELTPGDHLFQVADQAGNWLYRAEGFPTDSLPRREPDPGSAPRLEDLDGPGPDRLRLLAGTVAVGDRLYTVDIAASLDEFDEGLADFLWIWLALVPVVLVAASAGGYWMSRRALRPVDVIITTARSMSAADLSKRLPVPRTGDELERLSATLNELLARLELSFQRMVRFTADASHEFRTPLALMRTTAELALRDRQATGEALREALRQVLAEIERATRVVENLLLVARADAGTPAFAMTPVDLVACVWEAGLQAAPMARAKGLSVESALPDRPIEMLGDGQALRRLLLILLDNAVKYTPAGGRIHLALEADDVWAVVRVMDSGIGIAREDLAPIFERFYRVDKARSRAQGGSGLGLSIAQWIVESHDGWIEVESRLGGGSTFIVRLPRSVAGKEDRA